MDLAALPNSSLSEDRACTSFFLCKKTFVGCELCRCG
uniref:Uncharacterized protein n=1 Tax=Arundo donax TaxID=35708 RepID=A0A0A9EXV8_ARUDO